MVKDIIKYRPLKKQGKEKTPKPKQFKISSKTENMAWNYAKPNSSTFYYIKLTY